MDIKHPHPFEDDASASSNSRRTAPWGSSYHKEQPYDQREWWDAPVSGDPARDTSFFEFDLPEHLPSSPMCPANPKHKGKGKLVCVYHGRGRQASTVQGDETEESD
ncbi:hypothetical protein M406DRAFT_321631 [Cryphonectria parasitica EP155]|uniref:Uncharacterized protein n=1 Tax=Cryphonectria parasitica (strain ATCC 38755 / EP155) TaxID=660469 RepID=A0A9P5CRY8_CRYP1|nr:uncharacterized protein M406DRAFT_321631 [Cryphonectria parasitica EP155]KAF3767600.1 hypothetical protein M406DRAFT_321631 [Cryphonectria parasitica EP155]